jgi:membrane protein DedA with SNARE-associated domain
MFEWITSVIGRLGYAGVAALTFLEHLFPPIPSELVIPLAGYVAASGEMQVGVVIAVATFGSLAGASAWYALGRRVGEERLRAWVERNGKWLTLSARDIDHAAAWFQRHGKTAVLIGRLMPGVRTFVSLPAGFSKMPLVPFLFYSLIGTLVWTAALAYAGVVLRSNFAMVGDYINAATNVLFVVIGVMVARRYFKCWSESRRSHDDGTRLQERPGKGVIARDVESG